MTNVREVILPRDKRKDGTWNVKIRVTHQRKVKYISTLGILRKVIMSFRGKRSMYLAGGRLQQMLFQRFKVSY